MLGKLQVRWLVGFCFIVVGVAMSQPIDNEQALERGCRVGGPNDINRIDPQWVSVMPDDAPEIVEGIVTRNKLSYEDNPANHNSHDFVFHLLLDPDYQHLHSDANPDDGGSTDPADDNLRLMEMEWEMRYFSPLFWPLEGDRVWMMGRWVFDCGHPPYRTELHPPKAVAFMRLEPTHFVGDDMPVLTNRAYVYVHGRGGYYKTSVAMQNYEFDIPLPPKPPVGSLRDELRNTTTLRAEVIYMPFGGPIPILSPQPPNNPTQVHVTYPLNVGDVNPDLQFGAVLAVGWQKQSRIPEAVPRRGPTRFRKLKITFESLKINEDHDPGASGEWEFWVRAGSTWFEVEGLRDVDNDETIQIGQAVTLLVPEDGSWSVETTGWEDDCDGRFRDTEEEAEENDAGLADLQCFVDGNDRMGYVDRTYTAEDNFGIGTIDLGSTRNGSEDTGRDFTLRYRVEELARYPPPDLGFDELRPPTDPDSPPPAPDEGDNTDQCENLVNCQPN